MVRLTDHLEMTIAVDWDVKLQTKQTKASSEGSDETKIGLSRARVVRGWLFRIVEAIYMYNVLSKICFQWLSGRVLNSRPRGRGFEPHWHHCVVVLEQDTFILS